MRYVIIPWFFGNLKSYTFRETLKICLINLTQCVELNLVGSRGLPEVISVHILAEN